MYTRTMNEYNAVVYKGTEIDSQLKNRIQAEIGANYSAGSLIG